MSRERRGGVGRGDAQQRVRDMAPPSPDPAFAARLREDFLRGASVQAPPSSASVTPLKPRRAWQGFIAGAMAAAAALAVIGGANLGPRWTVHAVSGTGSARLDGVVVDVADRTGLLGRLHPGVVIEVPEAAQLDLELPGIALLQLTGGTRVVLPASPGRWFARSVRGRMEAGELRIATGPGFKGSQLSFVAATSEVRITGTTLAILAPPEGTCVCVFEGRVEMRESGSVVTPVSEGTRRVVYRDARTPLIEAIRPMESAKLGMLREEAQRTLGPNMVGHIPD